MNTLHDRPPRSKPRASAGRRAQVREPQTRLKSGEPITLKKHGGPAGTGQFWILIKVDWLRCKGKMDFLSLDKRDKIG